MAELRRFVGFPVCAAFACATTGPPAPEPGPPPAWVDGCRQAVERRDDRRLLVGVACMDDELVAKIGLRITTTQNRARAEASKLNDRFVAKFMTGYETECLGCNMHELIVLVERSWEESTGHRDWHATDGSLVCSRVDFDIQRDLLDRLDGAALEERLVSHVRAHAIATYDTLGPEVECEPPRPR